MNLRRFEVLVIDDRDTRAHIWMGEFKAEYSYQVSKAIRRRLRNAYPLVAQSHFAIQVDSQWLQS